MTAGSRMRLASDGVVAASLELDAIVDDAERALGGVRRELDEAWEASYRGTGVAILAAALALLAADLLLGLAPSAGTNPAWADELLRLAPPILLVVLGARFLWLPHAVRGAPGRPAHGWRSAPVRETIPDSRLADLLDRERSMRGEVGKLDTMASWTTVLLVLVGLGLLVLVLVGSADAARGIGPVPGLGAALLAAAGVVVVAGVLWSGRMHLRKARATSARISAWDRQLLALESRFMDAR